MHEKTLPTTSACTLRCNAVLGCTITDVTSEQEMTSELLHRTQSSHWSLPELKSDLHSNSSQVYMCDNEGCNTRNPMRTMHRVDFQVYR